MQSLPAVRNAPSLGGRFRVLPQLPPRNESGGRWSHAPAGRNKPANGRISARRLHLPTKAKAALAVCLSVSAVMRTLTITIPGTLAHLLLKPSRRALWRPIPPGTGH